MQIMQTGETQKTLDLFIYFFCWLGANSLIISLQVVITLGIGIVEIINKIYYY